MTLLAPGSFRAYRLVLFVGVLTAAMGVARAAEPVKIRLATLAPKGSSFHQILQQMGEHWKQAPAGGVSLTLYTDGVMGSEADMVRRMRIGQIQAAMLTVAGLAEIESSVQALQSMPMMFRSLEELDYVRSQLQPELEKQFLEKGFVVLFWGDAGWVRFFSRQPARTPEDFKKLKMFALAGSTIQMDIMKAAGYQPVALEYTDTLTGLQTGLIDAVPTAPFYALSGQLYNPAPHMLDVRWAPLVGGTVVTKKAWDSVPAAARDALLKAAEQAGEQIKQKSRAESEESVAAMTKRGLSVITPNSEELEAWYQLAEQVYPKIRGPIVPAETFDKVVALLKQYRASGVVPTP